VSALAQRLLFYLRLIVRRRLSAVHPPGHPAALPCFGTIDAVPRRRRAQPHAGGAREATGDVGCWTAWRTDSFGDLSGTVAPSSPYNLIGTGGSAGLLNAVNGNEVGVANPGLAPGLADNGGPTETIALLAGSPAIDAGSNALAVDPTTGQPLEYDQRGPGFPRIANGTVDISAFESPSLAVSLAAVTQPPSDVTTTTGFGVTVAALNGSGALRRARAFPYDATVCGRRVKRPWPRNSGRPRRGAHQYGRPVAAHGSEPWPPEWRDSVVRARMEPGNIGERQDD
jgi:hypothetical protein